MKHKMSILLVLMLLLPSFLVVPIKAVGETVSTLTMTLLESEDQQVADEFSLVVSDQALEAIPDESSYRLSLPDGIDFQDSSPELEVIAEEDFIVFSGLNEETISGELYLSIQPEVVEGTAFTLQLEKAGELPLFSHPVTITKAAGEPEPELVESVIDEPTVIEEVVETFEPEIIQPEEAEQVEEIKQPEETEQIEEPEQLEEPAATADEVTEEPQPEDDISAYFETYQYPTPSSKSDVASFQTGEKDLRNYSPEQIKMIYNKEDWQAAWDDRNIVVFNVMNDFLIDLSPSRIHHHYQDQNDANGTREIIVEGNGHTVDFRGTSYVPNSGTWHMTVQNLTAYSRNHYGPFTARSAKNDSTQTFHNYINIGSQMLYAVSTHVTFSGDVVNDMYYNYDSPFDGNNQTTYGDIDANLQISDLEMLNGSTFIGKTQSAGNIDISGSGNVIIGEDADIDLEAKSERNRSIGEALGYGINMNGTFHMKKRSTITYSYRYHPDRKARDQFGILNMSTDNTFIMEEDSKMIVQKDSHSSTRDIISIGARSNFQLGERAEINFDIGGVTYNNAAIELGNNSTFQLKKQAKVNMDTKNISSIHSAISLGTDSVFNLSPEAEVNLNLQGSGAAKAINAGGRSQFLIDSAASLIVNADGITGSIVDMGAGLSGNPTTFEVKSDNPDLGLEGGIVDITSINRGNSNNNIFSAGNYAKFKVGRLGTFNLRADGDGTGARYLLSLGSNSEFVFSDAKSVDLEFLTPPANYSALIYMYRGVFNVDVQRVKAWTRGQTSEEPTYDWSPMFEMEIPYSGYNVTRNNMKARSVNSEIRQEFLANFDTGRTNGFQRLLFEFIPDVEVELSSQPVDNPSDENATLIKGKTNPDAYVRLSETVVPNGRISFPTEGNLVKSPVEILDGEPVDEKNSPFTIQADETGDFEFKISEDMPVFTAGNIIEAYAFKNGKYATDQVTVLDTTPPEAEKATVHAVMGEELPDVAYFTLNRTDTNPGTVIHSQFKDTLDQLQQYMQQVGEYDVAVQLSDDAGNQTVIDSQLIIHATSHVLTGEDVTLYHSEVKDLSRNDFHQLVEENIQADSYCLRDFEHISLAEFIEHDFSQLVNEPGTYAVALSVAPEHAQNEVGLSHEVEVRIDTNRPPEIVNPDDPQPGTRPENGQENDGTKETGDLRLDYIPNGFRFGEVPLDYNARTYNALPALTTTGSLLEKQWVQVSDARTNESGWQLKIQQTQPFRSASGQEIKGAAIKIPQGKARNSQMDPETAESSMFANEIVLSAEAQEQTIFGAYNTTNSGKETSTLQWAAEEVKLRIPKGHNKNKETYQTEIQWALVSEPTQ
ncbi:WxL domain-containing protein [Enterococcus sp. 669A]|uniref:WxL domain-containing protein n=1 Tax=Candidatus Enterococcus moelleringii TaxID=2815325 RepID=A0ABS3LFQ6_9ENTE|nr:WxL domain-containing protein [Enterococcus sp. 669A]MBO1308483.1 WxL domain-containing protein [Enterococcus sp. 669A]